MAAVLELAINGAAGRMGRALQALAHRDPRFRLEFTASESGAWRDAPKLDVAIDFSSPEGFDAALAHCVAHRVAFVSGTTGLDAARGAALADAARTIPVLHASNFSLGIVVLTRLVREAAATLPAWDLEIIEAHHARKVDTPSGTALAIGRAAAQARGQNFGEVAVLSREGQVGARPKGAIGFASIRAGDIVGEHTALFAAAGERLELTHRATDRAIFARGAVAAAAWLAGKPAGVYSLAELVDTARDSARG